MVSEIKETRKKTGCPTCGNEMPAPRKYCSIVCRGMGRRNRVAAICQHCRAEFTKKASKAGPYCSMTCRRAAQEPGRVTSSCEQCGSVFSHKKSQAGQFCSDTCYHASRVKHETLTGRCAKCEQAFTYSLAHGYERRYCSRDCYAKAAWEGKTVSAVCLRCGEEFKNSVAHPHKFCSDQCYFQSKACEYVTKPCPHCRQDFTHPTSDPKIHCSRACQRAAKQEEIAFFLKHPSYWRNQQDRPYYGTSWPAARRAARARDKICADCGTTPEQTGQELSVHHLVAFRRFGLARHLEANDLSNLIAICQSCHSLREGWGKPQP